jgi:hypothetical protein
MKNGFYHSVFLVYHSGFLICHSIFLVFVFSIFSKYFKKKFNRLVVFDEPKKPVWTIFIDFCENQPVFIHFVIHGDLPPLHDVPCSLRSGERVTAL